jgi:hypothetical protein
MSTFPFHYKGPVTLSADGHYVDLHKVELWEERDVVVWNDGSDDVQPLGTYSWHGVAMAHAVPRRLFDLLGGEVALRLADGRLGHAQITGYCEDSLWIVEITGVGPVPTLNTI